MPIQIDVYDSIERYLVEYGTAVRSEDSHMWVLKYYAFQKDRIWFSVFYRRTAFRPTVDHSITPVLDTDIKEHANLLTPIPNVRTNGNVVLFEGATKKFRFKPLIAQFKVRRKRGDIQEFRNIKQAFFDANFNILNMIVE